MTEVTKHTFGSRLTPCVDNCCLDENDICLGCGRSITEITGWGMYSDEQKKTVLTLSQARLNNATINNEFDHNRTIK